MTSGEYWSVLAQRFGRNKKNRRWTWLFYHASTATNAAMNPDNAKAAANFLHRALFSLPSNTLQQKLREKSGKV